MTPAWPSPGGTSAALKIVAERNNHRDTNFSMPSRTHTVARDDTKLNSNGISYLNAQYNDIWAPITTEALLAKQEPDKEENGEVFDVNIDKSYGK